MAFLRIKPVRKVCKETGQTSTYNYVYEVASYKIAGKVKQKTLRLLGKYIQLEKQHTENFSIERALMCDSMEQFLKEIFAFNLNNYGFEQLKPDVFKNGDIIANLKTHRVFDEISRKDVYLNLNGKFFGTQTLRRALNSDPTELFEFVKTIIDSGAIGIEFAEFRKHKYCEKSGYNLKLLQAVLDKFGQFPTSEKLEEMSFEDFTRKIGY